MRRVRTHFYCGSIAGGASLSLSAPALDYPSAGNPPTIGVHVPADWQSGDVLKVARSLDPTFATGVTVMSRTMLDTDPGTTVSIGVPVLAGSPWYFQGYGNRGGINSANLSNKVAWGDAAAPVFTNAASSNVTETLPVAIALTFSTADVANVAIVDGADQLQFETYQSGGNWFARGFGNKTFLTSNPLDQGVNNVYNFTLRATDYGGNATDQAYALTIGAADLTPNAFSFTDANGVALSTLSTSNTVTIAGLGAGINAPVTVTGGQYSKNGAAFTAGAGTVQNGDTLQVRGTSSGSYSTAVNVVLNVGTGSDTYSITTLADPAAASYVASGTQPALQAASSATSTFAAIDFQLGRPVVYIPPLNGAITVTSVTIKGAGAAGADVACTLRASEAGAGQQSIWVANSVTNAAGSYDVAVVISSADTNWGIMCGSLINAGSAVATSTASKTFASNANPISTGSALTIPASGVGVAFCAHAGTAPRSAVNGTQIATGLNGWGGIAGDLGICSRNITAGAWTPSFTAAAQNFAAILAAAWGP